MKKKIFQEILQPKYIMHNMGIMLFCFVFRLVLDLVVVVVAYVFGMFSCVKEGEQSLNEAFESYCILCLHGSSRLRTWRCGFVYLLMLQFFSLLFLLHLHRIRSFVCLW